MGINKLPYLRDYWSNSEYLHYLPVASRISRNRFFEISQYLHFANNNGYVPCDEPGHDRLFKVRPVLNALRDSFLTAYQPHCQNSTDEAMVKFKGRSSLKQFLPKKPVI